MTKPPETLDSEAIAPDDNGAQHANIYEAVHAVMLEVGYVQKKYSDALRYSFAGEAAIMLALRESMIKHGIVMFPVAIEELHLQTYQTKNQAKDGGSTNRTVGKFTFELVHVSSGTRQPVTVLGEGADVGDKSANKAMTGGKKYALLQSFLLRTGDDPDEAPSPDMERNTPPTIEKRHWSENKLAATRFAQYMETNGLTGDDLVAVFGVENLFELPDDSHEVKAALEAHLAIKYASET